MKFFFLVFNYRKLPCLNAQESKVAMLIMCGHVMLHQHCDSGFLTIETYGNFLKWNTGKENFIQIPFIKSKLFNMHIFHLF